jgi:predicted ATP-grasp superfamily ATP-dependent carboligase
VAVFEHVTAAATAGLDRALVAQGAAMRDALVEDLRRCAGVQVTAVGGPGAPPYPAGASVRWACSGPAQDPLDLLHRLVASHDLIWAIAPETASTLVRLAVRVPASRWIGCSPGAIQVAGSKSATAEALRMAAVPVPAVWVPGMPIDPAAKAWVVKPDDGAGGCDARHFTRFAAARADYLERTSGGQAVRLESWIPGEALSLSVLAGEAVELLAINRQRVAVQQGLVRFDGVEVAALPLHDAEGHQLARLATRVVGAIPGLRGFIGIDVVRTPGGKPVVIEVNPRLTLSYVGLSRALTRNVAAAVLAGSGVRLPGGAS